MKMVRRTAEAMILNGRRRTSTMVPPSVRVVRWSRWRQAAMVALATGFLALGVWAWMLPTGTLDDLPRPVARSGAAVLVTTGAIAFMVAVRRLISGAVTGRIDPDGILWLSWSKTTIPWSEIAGYAVQEQSQGEGGRIRFISLWLFEPSRWPADRRITRWVNRKRLPGYGHLSLDIRGTDCSIVEAVETIQAIGQSQDLNAVE